MTAGNGRQAAFPDVAPVVPIGAVHWRQHARVRGRVRSMRVQPWANVASLECVIYDDSGGLVVVFLGRRQVAGVDLGRELLAEGVVGEHRGYLAMLNPEVELLAAGTEATGPRPAHGAPRRRFRRR
jgi:hypothetical protein